MVVSLASRLVPALAGVANYGNPFEILLCRLFMRAGEMTLVDRKTKITVKAKRRSYQMFGETWYNHDYDVQGCPVHENDVVVDIGANQGFFTCYMAQKGARVYAVEPNPETFEVLGRNIARNRFNDRVTARCVAVAGFEGDTELFCSSFLDGGTDTIVPSHAQAITSSGDAVKRVPVKVTRLSSLVSADTKVRLLKIDCEGAELEILKDLKNPERFDSIAIEYHPDAYPVGSLLKTIMEFGTHQVYMQSRQIIHAIRTNVLLEYAK